ncbi:hypothetical protein GCM10009077_10890 [Roseibium denhamense]
MMDDCFQSLGTPTIASQHTAIELLAEDASTAQDSIAPEPARDYLQLDTPTGKRKVSRPAHITALNSSAYSPAVRTSSKGLTRPQLNLNAIRCNLHFIY